MAALLALVASAALFAGCKGNTTAAALPEPTVGKPPTIRATRLPSDHTDDLRTKDPIANSLWQTAHWSHFVPPINAAGTTPPTTGAFLYDDAALYIAFVCQKSGTISGDAADTVSVYLDPHNEGKELLQISVNLETRASQATWYRSTLTAQPLENGAPDLALPIDRYPNVSLKGLSCDLRETTKNGVPEWTAVLAIPFRSLPGPLQAAPSESHPWKVNLIRTLCVVNNGRRVPQVQSNLSPVYMDAQYVSPYRLAELQFVR